MYSTITYFQASLIKYIQIKNTGGSIEITYQEQNMAANSPAGFFLYPDRIDRGQSLPGK
jgi:hypothetical protein